MSEYPNRHRFLAAMATVFLIATTRCGKNKPKPAPEIKPAYGIVSMVVGTVTRTDTKNNDHPVSVRDRIVRGETVRTAKKSFLVLQIEGLGVLRLQPQSVFRFEQLEKRKRTAARLEKGTLLSKIRKLRQNEAYIIRTPVAMASVRGTVFWISHTETKTSVSVRSGVVSAVSLNDRAPSPDSVMLQGGNESNSADILAQKDSATGRFIAPRKAKKIEKFSLDLIDIMPSIPDIEALDIKQIGDALSPVLPELEGIEKRIRSLLQKPGPTAPVVSPAPDKKLSPLEILQKQGKMIFRFSLRDGQVILATVVSQDANNIRLDTGAGIITVPKSEIVRRVPYE